MKNGKKLILIVEDEAFIAASEKKSLEEYGYAVIIASNGKNAIEAALSNPEIDLILMDIELGKRNMDGIQAAEKILKDRDIPVVFLSGHTDKEIVEKTEAISSYGYIHKNSGIAVIDASIKMAFKLYEANREIQRHLQDVVESETRFRRLAEAPFEGIVVHDNGIILDANRMLPEMFGYRFEEIIGMNILDLADPKYRGIIKHKVMTNDEEVYEAIGMRKDGSKLYGEIRGTSISYAGKDARVTAIRDITESIAFRESLKTRLLYEKALHEASRELLNKTDIDEALDRFLSHLQNASGVSRVYLFTNFSDPEDGLCMKQTHELCAPGVSPEIDNPELQHVPYIPDFRRWLELLGENIPVSGNIRDFPALEKAVLEPQGILSILVIPIRVSGGFYGFIGFDEIRHERKWDDENIRLLQTAADMVGTYIEKWKIEKDLVQAYEIINRSPVVAFKWGNEENWPVKYVTDNVIKLFGYSAQEFQEGKICYREVIHKDDIDRVEKEVGRVLDEEVDSFTHEPYRIITRDNLERWVSDTTYLVRDENGAVFYHEGIVYDITSLVEAVSSLRQSEERFKGLAELLPQTVFEMDADATFTFVNRAGLATFGYTEEEIKKGLNAFQTIAPEDRDRAKQGFIDRISDARDTYNEYRALRKDSSSFPAVVYANVIWENGKFAGFRGILTDVTGLKKAQEALRESEEKFRSIAEHLSDMISLTDENGVITYASPASESLFGMTPDEMIGSHFMAFLDESSVKKAIPEFRDTVEKGNMTTNLEITAMRKDKSSFIGEVTGQRFNKGTLVTIRDITERKRSEEALAESLKEKEALFRELQHRVKNSMTAIGNIIDLELMRTDGNKTRDVLNNVASRVKSMSELYLMLYESGSVDRVDMEEYCVSVIQSLVSSYGSGGVEVIMDFDAVSLDFKRALPVGLLFTELITNAYKYGFPDNKTGTITVSFKQAENTVVMTVSDTGIGLPDDFDIENSGGTGLEIVRGLADQIDATLHIDGSGGMTVEIEFPYKED